MNLALIGRSRRPDSSPSVLEIFSFDPKITSLSASPLVFCSLSLFLDFLKLILKFLLCLLQYFCEIEDKIQLDS